MMLIIDIFKNGLSRFYKLFGIYLLWILIYYLSSHLHAQFCTPYGIQGFLMTPLVSQMPHCQAFRWVIYNGGSHINAFWFVISGLLIKSIQG
jgi:hypothetical protein